MKTYLLLFAWVPLAMAFMGTGQPNFGIYFIASLILLGICVNRCDIAASVASVVSKGRITNEMLLAALRAETETEWEERFLASHLFRERGKP